MSRPGMLRFLGVDPEAWGRRHGVEPFVCPCSECGEELEAAIPYAWGQMRGFVAPDCECGNKRVPYCVAWDTLPG